MFCFVFNYREQGLCPHEYRCPWRPEGASDTLELELQSSSEPPNVLIIKLRSSTRGVCASYLQHPLPSMFKESYPVFLSVT